MFFDGDCAVNLDKDEPPW